MNKAGFQRVTDDLSFKSTENPVAMSAGNILSWPGNSVMEKTGYAKKDSHLAIGKIFDNAVYTQRENFTKANILIKCIFFDSKRAER